MAEHRCLNPALNELSTGSAFPRVLPDHLQGLQIRRGGPLDAAAVAVEVGPVVGAVERLLVVVPLHLPQFHTERSLYKTPPVCIEWQCPLPLDPSVSSIQQ